jgi:dTDP-4-dehydrorhamnose 3,5-epimerase
MRFDRTPIEGVAVVEVEPIEDERGFFARSWCLREFADHGLHASFVQENVGFNRLSGTLRGLHFQHAPFEEVKLVKCTSGVVWDVAVDLRLSSPTYCRWTGVELSAQKRTMLYVPKGCAHGYLSLTDRAEIRYLTSEFFEPDAASGVRYDDPALALKWPAEIRLVSERDRTWHLLNIGDERDGVL